MVKSRTWRAARVSVVVSLIAVALLASACGGSTGGSSESPPEGTAPEGTLKPIDGGSLAIGVQGDAAGWNTHISAPSQAPAFMVSSMLETLAVLAADGTAQPWLALTWTPNETHTEWDVALREGVTFQNGEAFDAAAVVANTNDAINGLVSGQVVKGLITDVVAVNPTTVHFTLSESWAAFPISFLTNALAFQMAPAALLTEDKGNSNPIGTGPFEFGEWVAGDHLEVTKNASYWQAGRPHLDEINFKILVDGTSRAAALRSGDIDMMLTTSPLDANDLETEGYQVIRDWDTQAEMVVLNTAETARGEPNPLSNIHARRAVARATDQDAVAALVGDGIETPTSPFSPDSPWGMPKDQNGYPGFDLEKAKEELQLFKDETGAGSLSFSLLSTTDPDDLQVAQFLQGQWAEAGIEVKIDTIEPAAAIGKVVSGQFNSVLIAVYNSPDPDMFHIFWAAKSIGGPGKVNINLAQYTTPKIEADLKAGRESSDPAEREAAYDDLVRQLNDGAINVWLHWTPYTLVADQRVHGLEQAAELPLANFQFKPIFGDLWLSD